MRDAQDYWIGVASLEHVSLAVQGGFIQLNHGKEAPLQRMHAGDGIIMYSPRNSDTDDNLLQQFTAIGIILTGDVYRVKVLADFMPFRMNVHFLKSHDVSVKPLIGRLSFIRDKVRWGAPFRFGHFRIPPQDFMMIARAMGVGPLLPFNRSLRPSPQLDQYLF